VVHTIVFKSPQGQVRGLAVRAFEDDRDVIEAVRNYWGIDPDPEEPGNLSQYDYVNDVLRRRTNVSYSGAAFGSPGTPIPQPLSYNARNELTLSDRSGTAWSYGYDPIGNRQTYVENPGTAVTTAYLTNELNQYHRADVVGAALLRQGLRYDTDGNLVEYFVAADMNCDGVENFGDINPFILALSDPDGYAATYPNCDILNGDINGDGATNLEDLNPFIALMQNGGGGTGLRAEYAWDSKNRLIAVTPLAPMTGSQKVEFSYDYLGRRVEKRVYNWTGSDWPDEPSAKRRFVWSGWLLMMELDGLNDNAVVRRYIWGLDWAGLNGQLNSLEAAGGVGGLLAMQAPGAGPSGGDLNAVYFYDGNGNVGQVVDLLAADIDAAIKAAYEYDPYGRRTNTPAEGEYDQPVRFSTKYWDDETELGYWGYRYYDPRLGRWISEDPLGEEGGLNLYAYVLNGATDAVDPLGTTWLWNPSYAPKQVCCEYDVSTTHTHTDPGTSWSQSYTTSSICRSTRLCPLGSSDPKACCEKTKCSLAAGLGWTQDARMTLRGATWGRCCWCELSVRRLPMWTIIARTFAWHHILVLDCPAHDGKPAFRKMIDLYPSTVRRVNERDRPAAFRNELKLQFVAPRGATRKITCEDGDALSSQWDTKYPGDTNASDLYNFPFYQCRSFAFDGLDSTGGKTECRN
jgi:RHS repeat-associated protein